MVFGPIPESRLSFAVLLNSSVVLVCLILTCYIYVYLFTNQRAAIFEYKISETLMIYVPMGVTWAFFGQTVKHIV